MCEGSVTRHPALNEDRVRAELGRLRVALRREGHAVTAKRLAIYEVLLRNNNHLCVEHILESIARDHPDWRINKTTAYRTLEILQDLGLVSAMKQPDGRTQYEITLHGPHGHLLCQECGTLRDLDPDVADTLCTCLQEREHFALDLSAQALVGVCEECAQRAAV